MSLIRTLLWAAVAYFACATHMAYCGDFDGWSQGRASFYGDDGGTTIDQGSCMFGYLDPNKGTGRDIAALSDKAYDYAGSCGRCYEVACRSTTVKDGYGNSLDRTGTCQGQKSVTVMVTDTCPCYYPSNAYSNTRWCCGDEYHMDLSKWAFEKIGNTGDGVMGIYYRQVDCPGTSSGSSSSSSSSSGGSSNSGSWSSSSSSSGSSSSGSWSSSSSSSSGSSSSGSSSSSGGGSSWSWSSSGSSSDGSSSSSSSSSSSGDSNWHSDMLDQARHYADSNWPNRNGRRKLLTLGA